MNIYKVAYIFFILTGLPPLFATISQVKFLGKAASFQGDVNKKPRVFQALDASMFSSGINPGDFLLASIKQPAYHCAIGISQIEAEWTIGKVGAPGAGGTIFNLYPDDSHYEIQSFKPFKTLFWVFAILKPHEINTVELSSGLNS